MTDPDSRPDAMANPAGDGVQISGRRAAQGRTGGRAFIILIASVVLVVAALFGAFAFHSPGLAKGGASGGQSGAGAASRVFNTPEPSPKQSPAGTPSTEPATQHQPGT